MEENNFGMLDFNIRISEPNDEDFERFQIVFDSERPLVKNLTATERNIRFKNKLRALAEMYQGFSNVPYRFKKQFQSQILSLPIKTENELETFKSLGGSKTLTSLGVVLEGFETEETEIEETFELDNSNFESNLPKEEIKIKVQKNLEKPIEQRAPRNATEIDTSQSGFNKEFYDFCHSLTFEEK